MVLPRVRAFVAGEQEPLVSSWSADGDENAVFDIGIKNLNVLMERPGASKFLSRPVPWLMADRERLGRAICSRMGSLGKLGRTRPVHYFAVTGHRGVGKTTVLCGVMDVLHAATPVATGGPTLFPLGLFQSPVTVAPAIPNRPFEAPPRLERPGAPRTTIPLPPVLLAVEVLRAYGHRELPGFREVTAPSGSEELTWARWHPHAFRADALERLSAWCLEHRVHPCVFIDEFQAVFGSGIDPEFAARWHAQLSAPTFGLLEPSALFCLGGSSAYADPILFNASSLKRVPELGSLPQARRAMHSERVPLHTLAYVTTLEEMKWMVNNSTWPSKPHPAALAVFSADESPADSPADEPTDDDADDDDDDDSTGDGGGDCDGESAGSLNLRLTPESVLRATLGLPRLLSEFAELGQLQELERESSERLAEAMDAGMRTVYLALATHVARKGDAGNTLSTSPLALRRDSTWVARADVLRSVELLHEYLAAPTGVLPGWFLPDMANWELRHWAELGFLSIHDSKLTFPAPVFLVHALEELAALTYGLDPEIVRMVIKPGGRTRLHAGNPIVAATLCHHHGGMSTLGHLSEKLVKGTGVPVAEFESFKNELASACFSWTEHEMASPADGLRSMECAAVWPPNAQSPTLVPRKLYRPLSDSFGADLFSIIPTDHGASCVIWLLMCQIKLSAGAGTTFITPGEVSAAASKFAKGVGRAGARYSEICELAIQQAGKPAVVRPLVLLATNRHAASAMAVAHSASTSRRNSMRCNVHGVHARAHDSGLLVPQNGAGLLLTRDMLAPHWSPPIRLLAHDQNLSAYGGTLDPTKASELAAGVGRCGDAHGFLSGTAKTHKEKQALRRRELREEDRKWGDEQASERRKQAQLESLQQAKACARRLEARKQHEREIRAMVRVLEQRCLDSAFAERLVDAGITAAAIEARKPIVFAAIAAAQLPPSLTLLLGIPPGVPAHGAGRDEEQA